MKIEDLEIKLKHIKLAALRYGSSEKKILALHGWLDNAYSFLPLAEILVKNSYELIALEFAGHGHSEHRPQGVGYHFSDYLYDTVLAIKELKLEKIDLLCHSMGAALMPMLASAFPEFFRKIICLDLFGTVSTSDIEPLPKRYREQIFKLDYLEQPRKIYKSLDALIKARRLAGEMDLNSAKLLVERGSVKLEDGFKLLSDTRLKEWQPNLASEEQNLQFIREIQNPILMIEASLGIAKTLPFLEKRYKEAKNLQRTVLEGGHHIHLDKPELVGKEILRFLET